MATPKKQSNSANAAAKTAVDQSAAEKSAAAKPAHIAPVVNLSHAAQTAAMMLAGRKRRVAEGEDAAPVNAATFKKMKDGLATPQYAAGSPLASLNKPPKPTGSAGFMKQAGHGQAGGANVARTGVPRRTSGG